MSAEESRGKVEAENSKVDTTDDTAGVDDPRPKEVGGRGGLDPTRYGDWEKSGRCIDF